MRIWRTSLRYAFSLGRQPTAASPQDQLALARSSPNRSVMIPSRYSFVSFVLVLQVLSRNGFQRFSINQVKDVRLSERRCSSPSMRLRRTRRASALVISSTRAITKDFCKRVFVPVSCRVSNASICQPTCWILQHCAVLRLCHASRILHR